MREFFKYVFATVVGFVISIVVAGVLFFIVIAAVISSMNSEKGVDIVSNSVLFLDLNQPITERTPKNTFGNLPIIGNDGKEGIGLNDLLKSISRA